MADFAGLVRTLIPVAEALVSSFEATVTHRVWKSQSATGKVTYANVSRLAIVDMKSSRVAGPGGEIAMSKAELLFPRGGITVSPKDQFTLPDGLTYAVMAITGPLDPTTGVPFATTVYLS